MVDDSPKEPEAGPRLPNRIEQERVNLVGRVGTEPRFRTTKNQELVCNFALAEHDEKGQEVEVVGYVHVQEKS